MNVTEGNWQLNHNSPAYRSVRFKEDTAKAVSDTAGNADRSADEISEDSAAAMNKASENSASGGKIKSSAPEDSVGQLAAELARSETKLDVLQVLSKATRALANLKMSAYACEGKDAKKAAQLIKRMEKLIKRIQKKVKQLGKEEQMEIQQRKAEKQRKIERAKEIREELRGKRNKRRREERDYALKELAEDGKESLKETISSIAGAGAASLTSGIYAPDAAGGVDLSAISLEGMSIDISV